MLINGEPFTTFEIVVWEESEKAHKPVRNYNLFMKIISVMAGAILGWHLNK